MIFWFAVKYLQAVLTILLDSLRSAIELSLLVLLPIMVVMLAIMKVLQSKGVLDFIARVVSPWCRVFGLSGLSVIAALQELFVSFAAPPTTIAMMVQKKVPSREIAATVAMILAMSQANAAFPLTAIGLSLWVAWLTSVLGGLSAAALTYYVLFKPPVEEDQPSKCDSDLLPRVELERRGIFRTAFDGAREGFQLVVKAMPIIVVAVLAVNIVAAIGAVALLEQILAPVLDRIGLSGVAVLPLVTKYVAGGTAMMGVTLDLVREGSLSVSMLNRVAGLMINPLDAVGLAVLIPAVGKRRAVIRPAILGAIGGILIRGILHLMIF